MIEIQYDVTCDSWGIGERTTIKVQHVAKTKIPKVAPRTEPSTVWLTELEGGIDLFLVKWTRGYCLSDGKHTLSAPANPV